MSHTTKSVILRIRHSIFSLSLGRELVIIYGIRNKTGIESYEENWGYMCKFSTCDDNRKNIQSKITESPFWTCSHHWISLKFCSKVDLIIIIQKPSRNLGVYAQIWNSMRWMKSTQKNDSKITRKSILNMLKSSI